MCSRVSQSSQYSLVKGLIIVSNITTHARAREDAKLLHTVERRRFIDELRHQKTRQGAFDKAMWHLDHPIPGTSCYLMPSDHGAGAKAIYAAIEPKPHWQKMWKNAITKLPPTGRSVLRALQEDWRSRPAARIAGVSQPTVDRWKTIFKVHFAQCFRAYKRDFSS